METSKFHIFQHIQFIVSMFSNYDKDNPMAQERNSNILEIYLLCDILLGKTRFEKWTK